MSIENGTPVDQPAAVDDSQVAVDPPGLEPRSSRLELHSRYPYYVDLPEIQVVWQGCSPSVDTFARLLMVLATIPTNVRRPGPESHQR